MDAGGKVNAARGSERPCPETENLEAPRRREPLHLQACGARDGAPALNEKTIVVRALHPAGSEFREQPLVNVVETAVGKDHHHIRLPHERTQPRDDGIDPRLVEGGRPAAAISSTTRSGSRRSPSGS